MFNLKHTVKLNQIELTRLRKFECIPKSISMEVEIQLNCGGFEQVWAFCWASIDSLKHFKSQHNRFVWNQKKRVYFIMHDLFVLSKKFSLIAICVYYTYVKRFDFLTQPKINKYSGCSVDILRLFIIHKERFIFEECI